MLQLKVDGNCIKILATQNEKSILEVTKLIGESKNSQKLSTLFTNRGVVYCQSGNWEWALSDLEKGLEYNHLNYAIYFNIFSVLISEGNLVEGLKNLCCAISCLYLARGKSKNNETDINKCVKLADNNNQGRLLKALFYQKKSKHKLALNEIKWILDSQPTNLQVIQIRNHIQSLLQPNETRYNDQEEDNNNSIENSIRGKSRRLVCTIYDDLSLNQNFQVQNEISERLLQFNQLYGDVVENTVKLNEQVCKNTFFIPSKTIKRSQKYQRRQQLFQKEQNLLVSEKSCQINISPPKIQKVSSGSNENRTVLDYAGLADSYLVQSSLSQEDNLAQFQKSGPQGCFLGNENKESIEKSGASYSFQKSKSFVSVKARDQEKQINIKLEKIQMNQGFDRPESNKYCVFQYGENKISLIKSRPMEESLEVVQYDNDEGKTLRVKVFNKKIHAFKDELLGLGSQEIRVSGFYSIPVYLNEELAGRVELNIEMP